MSRLATEVLCLRVAVLCCACSLCWKTNVPHTQERDQMEEKRLALSSNGYGLGTNVSQPAVDPA